MKRNFRELLENAWSKGKFVCGGLDSDINKLPKHLRRSDENKYEEILSFNLPIIRQTADIIGFSKPNAAAYQKLGPAGVRALRRTIEMIHTEYPEILVILDCKDTDIGKTNEWYVEMAFEYFKADAVTVNPYFGGESLTPFLKNEDKGIIVLCRTSNPGAGEFQNMDVSGDMVPGGYMPLYKYVAHRVARNWNTKGNCGLVVGATAPEELSEVRKIVGDGFPILIPGVGTQGGDLETSVKNGRDSQGRGFIVNAGSSTLFASGGEDFADAARLSTQALHDDITIHLAAKA